MFAIGYLLGGAGGPIVAGILSDAVAAGSTSGRTLRLKGKGFHKKGGARGDQLVTLMIDVPDDEALRAFVKDWAGGERNPRAALGV